MRPSLALRAAKTPGLDRAQKASRRATLPLARTLAQNDKRKGAAARRADIVSPALCDDILSFIGPSLEQYKHCDIVDANPGAALWSSKIHDLLQPRRHILCEPDAFYKPFLQPLIDRPGSKYVNGPSDESALQSLAAVLADGLPEQQPLKPGDPRLNQPNTSLLVLLNLSRINASGSRGIYMLTRDILNTLTASAWTHGGIHRYGQVRMLVWVGEYFKHRLVPRELNDMDSYGLSFEYRTNTSVVADHPAPKLPRDETTLDLASAVRAVEKMRALNLQLPLNRQSILHREALSITSTRDISDVQADLKSDIVPRRDKEDEIKELEAAFESGALSIPKMFHSGSKHRKHDIWWDRLTELKKFTPSWMQLKRSIYVKNKPHIALADHIHQLELIVVDESRPAQERLAAKEEMEKLRADLMKGVRRLGEQARRAFHNVLDNRKAFYRSPSALSWDNRAFEPLCTEPHEFYPQQSLTLLDITPKPAPREYSMEDIFYWQRFADRMFDRTSTSVGKALDNMRLGSAEIILPEVGAIHDPRRGGSFDVEDVRVRSLTPEMMDEIVNAWRNWTFRPESLEKIFTETRLSWDELMALDADAKTSFF
ncbi:hypothetical protein SLS56_000076 [Neofusicoccum ribis]|uniref:Mitochondrial transcription factor 1 n=1 Tax=Neofusicoccum ribis TaxID=45134 RepID=A0ABR3TFV8_9PEZI